VGGLAGILFSAPDRRVGAEALAAQARALRGTGAGTEGAVLIEGPFGIAAQASPGIPASIARRDVGGAPRIAAIAGVLYAAPGVSRDQLRAADPAEILLDLYERSGVAGLGELDGDFALALWDASRDELHLLVDPFRVRPLFVASDGSRILFGTKLRAVTASPHAGASTLDPRAVIELVESSRISTPHTIVQGVSKVPEGHRVTYARGRAEVERYWRPEYRTPDRRTHEALTADLKERFERAVRVRIEVDGTSSGLGAYLSGGIDSTTVVAVLSRLLGRPAPAFSIAFEEAGFNELGFARTAAEAYGSEHHVYHVTARDTLDAIPLLIDTFDEPFGNASAVPAYYCARMAAERGIHTLFAGDGGDELFAGNEHYASRRVFEYYDRIPPPLRSLVVEPAAMMAGSLVPWGLFRKAKKYVERARVPYPARLATYSLYRELPRTSLFEPGFLELAGDGFDPFQAQASRYRDAPADSELDRQLYVDLRLLIVDSDLFKVTRTAEAAGIAVRFPFLDRPLAEFAATVPAGLKMRGLELRSFFKDAYADLLPEETRLKKKHGFGLPIAGWLRTEPALNELMRELVLGARARERGILSRRGAEELVRLHREDTTSFFGTALWNLMMLELWLRHLEAREPERAGFGKVPC
jgi:asparagine synthase (glutamine-hydrolysing)